MRAKRHHRQLINGSDVAILRASDIARTASPMAQL